MKLFAYAALLTTTSLAFAQAPPPLPANYKTIYENADVLVMKVHYGPHEFVPMHDHTAFPTVYVYLNNSGVVDLKHDGPDAEVVHRPPTHAGTFRIAPGVSERHSVTNLSDLPSDFLRIELKRVPPDGITKMVRGTLAPDPPMAGTQSEFSDATLQIQRTICPDAPGTLCRTTPLSSRSLIVVLNGGEATGSVFWLWAEDKISRPLGPGTQYLRLFLKYP